MNTTKLLEALDQIEEAVDNLIESSDEEDKTNKILPTTPITL